MAFGKSFGNQKNALKAIADINILKKMQLTLP